MSGLYRWYRGPRSFNGGIADRGDAVFSSNHDRGRLPVGGAILVQALLPALRTELRHRCGGVRSAKNERAIAAAIYRCP